MTSLHGEIPNAPVTDAHTEITVAIRNPQPDTFWSESEAPNRVTPQNTSKHRVGSGHQAREANLFQAGYKADSRLPLQPY